MRFVHLAPRSAIGRIRRHGLRLGDGRRGKGVYAVPLFRVRRMTVKRPDDLDARDLDFSVPLSSATLWRHLFGGSSPSGRRPVAVVFQLPPSCWPVDIYLEVGARKAASLLAALRSRRGQGLEVSDAAMAFVSGAAASGFLSDLEARAHDADAVGLLLREYLATDPGVWSRYDESVEVVVRTPVPAKAVRRLVPLSQTNVEARTRRELQRGVPELEDDA